ncbi:hypothetical protein [Dysgonomonas sp. ZJ279]|uniref:hypothetical protein n=1 Tax=Dysgonomonas sp. ZJ279 TaxID=2709796 RepID=UPI0013ECC71B|nr:hypothetical protein [Dysgonomonas sp. ZJ279]
MGELKAIATNEYSTYETEISVVSRSIKDAYWEDSEGKKTNGADLEETVYFIIKTEGFSNGNKIKLQLMESDAPAWSDTEFAGKEIKIDAIVQNNQAKVELYLDESWAQMIKDDNGETIELYWEATFEQKVSFGFVEFSYDQKTDLCYSMTEYLRVGYSQRKLYIRPSQIDDKFPELYSSIGEQIVLVVSIGKSDVIDSIESSTKNMAHQYSIAKISHGYMVAKNGTVFGPETTRGGLRQVHKVEFYNSDGRFVSAEQGYDFSSRRKNGQMTSTRGVNQYEYHYNSEIGCKVKILGTLRKVGMVWDVFDIFRFATNPSNDSALPIPAIPGANLIGMIAHDKFQEFETDYETSLDKHQRKLLSETKPKGMDAVKRLIWGNEAGYAVLDISSEMASDIIHGKFKTFEDIENKSYNIKKTDVAILFRRMKHPISEKDIVIIETFFMK